jgi:hypothetical protein
MCLTNYSSSVCSSYLRCFIFFPVFLFVNIFLNRKNQMYHAVSAIMTMRYSTRLHESCLVCSVLYPLCVCVLDDVLYINVRRDKPNIAGRCFSTVLVLRRWQKCCLFLTFILVSYTALSRKQREFSSWETPRLGKPQLALARHGKMGVGKPLQAVPSP